MKKYKFTEEHRRNMSKARKNSKVWKKILKSKEYREKMRQSTSGFKNGNYKGIGNFTCYDTYEERLSFCEELRRDNENGNLMNVKCIYCGKWFRPTRIQTENRLIALKELTQGEQRFYCSNECKNLCPTYRQYKYPSDFKKMSTEVSPELRKMVFERDNWECQKCEEIESLECHHIDPISQEPLFANDIDSCITLCVECHKEIHMNIKGCGYGYLKRANC